MPRVSETVDPARSPWHLLGATLRHWRDEVRGLGLRDVAAAAFVDYSHLAKWERGDRPPPADAIARLDDCLTAHGQLIALHDAIRALTSHSLDGTRSPARILDDDAMDALRRRLLQSLGALGLSGVLPVDVVGQVRQALRTVDSDAVADWEEIAWEYAFSLIANPPGTVVADLAADLLELQDSISQAKTEDHRSELTRVSANLSLVMAQVLGYLGQRRESRRWWQQAERRAERSGDTELTALAYACEAMQALYEHRPLVVVMARVDSALQASPDKVCAGVLEARAARAQVRAVIGDQDGATADLHTVERDLARLPDAKRQLPVSTGGWSPMRLLHARSYVHSRTGRLSAAADAQDTYLSECPPDRRRGITQIQLHEALCTVRAGDALSGIAQARAVLDTLPPAHHTLYVREAAVDVLASVPEGARTRPQVIEYRDHLALPISSA